MDTETEAQSPPPRTRPLKRRRVALACQKCRHLKAKCDGVKPRCGRCTAYEYECVWSDEKQYKTNEPTDRPSTAASSSDLHDSSNQNDPLDLLNSLLHLTKPPLDEKDRQKLEEVYQNVYRRRRNDKVVSSSAVSWTDAVLDVHPFHGEASGEEFIKNMSHDGGHSHISGSGMIDRSYTISGTNITSTSPISTPLISKDEGTKYMMIFASTIGVAYPFIPLDQLDDAVCQWAKDPESNTLSTNWQALVLAVFAVGACYETLSSPTVDQKSSHNQAKHTSLFQNSFDLLTRYDRSRNLERVWAGLAQCFYLLATTQVDRGWSILGRVIRLAQSIGLHTNKLDSRTKCHEDVTGEQRRITWYCIYGLDHLLSLQLGRPPGIYSPFFSVDVPSNIVSLQNGGARPLLTDISADEAGRAVRDYMLAMIDLSHEIEEVMRTLYTPQSEMSADRYTKTANLDKKLQSWKTELPRRLRFDLGHTFESSSLHRRHRNYLATKYYNLRSLIHRPSLSLLKRHRQASDAMTASIPLPNNVHESIITCIDSAQNTARLLYDVKDRKDFVHNYPWWQMISCLICAGSILLVAAADRQLSATLDVEVLEQDALLCLQVFNTLSISSEAAEGALILMNKFRNIRTTLESQPTSTPATSYPESDTSRPPLHSNSAVMDAGGSHNISATEFNFGNGFPSSVNNSFMDVDYSVDNSDPSLFYANDIIYDPFLWSMQFLNDGEVHPADQIKEMRR